MTVEVEGGLDVGVTIRTESQSLTLSPDDTRKLAEDLTELLDDATFRGFFKER